MKKLLGGFLALILVLTLLPGAALAETVENVPTLSIAAGQTTQQDIDDKWGAGTVEYTSSVVDGKTVYTVKLLKNVVLKAGCDFRINEYNVGGTSLPSVILDLNGCTITSQSIGLISGGNLTIRDTSEAQTGGITYSTTSDKSSLTTISHSGGTLVIEGGTFTCQAGYAFTGYVATVSTQLGGVTYIKGGTFVGNSSAVLSSNDGKTVVEGGTFTAPYGMYVKPGSSGEPGVIEIPADSTAVVNASSYAMVVQRVNGADGTITAAGGTINAPKVVGGVSKPDTKSAVSISGGTYSQDPSGWVTENTPVAQLTLSGKTGAFLVGEKTVADAAAGAAAGDTIEVLVGNLQLSGLPDGVTVKNSGSGTVSANGGECARGRNGDRGERPAVPDRDAAEGQHRHGGQHGDVHHRGGVHGGHRSYAGRLPVAQVYGRRQDVPRDRGRERGQLYDFRHDARERRVSVRLHRIPGRPDAEAGSEPAVPVRHEY